MAIENDPAFTAPSAVISAIKQLSGDASFEISLGNDTVQGSATSVGDAFTLNDSGPNFATGKVKVGDTVFNLTDASKAKVIEIAPTQLKMSALTGGIDNLWQSGDLYRTAHVITVGQLIGVPGTDINASQISGSQRETTIAVNPIDAKHIVIAPNHVPGIRLDDPAVPNAGVDDDLDGVVDDNNPSQDSIWVTRNGGQLWTEVKVNGPAGALGGHGDPTLAFSRDGSRMVYVHMVDKTGPHGDHVMASAVFTFDAGGNWVQSGSGVLSLNGNVIADEDGDGVNDDSDKEYMAVGPDPSDLSKDLFVTTWHRGRVIFFSSSSDGLAWSDPVVIGGLDRTTPASPVPLGQVPQQRGTAIDSVPTFGPNGEIFVTWEEYPAAGVGRIMFDASFDGGKTWGAGQDIKVFFDSAESAIADLTAADRTRLDAFAALMVADRQLVATVAGFTDTAGDTQPNQVLSEARALSVFNHLVSKGVLASQLKQVAFGETVSWLADPTANGIADPDNRRVELMLDRIIYTGSMNAFNDPFGAGGLGLDGADTDYEIPAQPERGIWFGLSIDADNSDGPKSGRVYISFVDQSDLDANADAANAFDHHDTDVFVIASDDNGTTWGALSASPDIAIGNAAWQTLNPGVSAGARQRLPRRRRQPVLRLARC